MKQGDQGGEQKAPGKILGGESVSLLLLQVEFEGLGVQTLLLSCCVPLVTSPDLSVLFLICKME